ncbi:MAG: T9SS type A sorting domain-containing protein [Flavobacteriales bacterium]|nr:T9SS type A sorting domain-containing protein [Flavobacteriales bacterium]
MKLGISITIITFFAVGIKYYAQSAADCIGAVPMCTNPYTLNFIPKEQNNVAGEINSSNTCLATGDTKGRWYRFASTGAGFLKFSIIPQDTTYDLDWALFSMYNRPCSDIWSDASLLLSCNFYGIQGNNGSTGISDTPGGPFSPSVYVDTITLFYLYVSHHWLGNNDTLGYTIDFTGTTFSFQNCSIIGLNNLEITSDVKVFPNPFFQTIHLEGIHQEAEICLYNIHGQLVLSQKYQQSPIIIPHTISQGLYMLKIKTSNEIYLKKIIKEN